MRAIVPTLPRRLHLVILAVALFTAATTSFAEEVAQGSFVATLDPGSSCGGGGGPSLLGFTSTFQFDDKTFHVNVAPGNNQIELNFSELGVFHATGDIVCSFDVGGRFNSTATNEAGDFTWIQPQGEYLDHKPGIGEGDPFPWVAGARCETTRTDQFKTLCDNFELSWNGLSKAQAPNPGYSVFAGDLNVRTAQRVHVAPGGGSGDDEVVAPATVDGDGGDVPDVQVTFRNGVASEGDLSISTLADAHGTLPSGAVLPTLGTTEIDHGSGAVPFFEGGDERFIEIHTDAELPMMSRMEVCLPLPATSSAADVRPVRVLHGEGDDYDTRRFVDRTSRIDHAAGKACASVSSFSKFVVVTTDVCGSGKASSDGIVTIAGGLAGRKNVIFDGVTDCANLPSDVPPSLAALCVPDADDVAGQCSVSLTLGVDRAGCNSVAAGVDAAAQGVNRYSYEGTIRGRTASIDLTSLFHDALYALTDSTEATVGPVTVALPLTGTSSKYRLSQKMYGGEPGSGAYVADKDAVLITCTAP